MFARLAVVTLAIMVLGASGTAWSDPVITITAQVTSPTNDQQFNGTTGSSVSITFSSDHSYQVTGGVANDQYTCFVRSTLTNGGGASGNVTLTVNVNGLSNRIEHHLSTTVGFTVLDGLRTYDVTAASQASNIQPAIAAAPANPRTHTITFKTYGEG